MKPEYRHNRANRVERTGSLRQAEQVTDHQRTKVDRCRKCETKRLKTCLIDGICTECIATHELEELYPEYDRAFAYLLEIGEPAGAKEIGDVIGLSHQKTFKLLERSTWFDYDPQTRKWRIAK